MRATLVLIARVYYQSLTIRKVIFCKVHLSGQQEGQVFAISYINAIKPSFAARKEPARDDI